MLIKILMITFNRPFYTKLSLDRLLNTAPENARITVWDNGSSPETVEIIKSFEEHPRIERIVYNQKNDKLWAPTNWFWTNSAHADFIGKVDDDCLVPENWCETLQQCHSDIPDAGILGCWHYLPEDFSEKDAHRKIQSFSNHKIMRNCWVGGSGYLMKKAVLKKIGYLKQNESFTQYCIRAALKGFINGWYYPFLYQDHMDDPRSKYTAIKSDKDLEKVSPLTANAFNVNSIDDWLFFLKENAYRLQIFSYNPHDIIGLKTKIIGRIARFMGRAYIPRVK